jgi:hypothetical protein
LGYTRPGLGLNGSTCAGRVFEIKGFRTNDDNATEFGNSDGPQC